MRPSLRIRAPRGPVCGVALVLHGGRSRSLEPTRPWQPAVVRMLPFARSLRRAGGRHGLAVARLRYRVRGWNDPDRSPVQDTQWALDRIAGRFPGARVALVGHSMGARSALYVAAHPSVRVVVGLAPWVEDGDGAVTLAGLAGRRLLIAHGALDRTTDPRVSAAYARAAARTAASVSYITVTAGTHAMLGRAGVWHELATGYVLGALCETPGPGSTNSRTSTALAGALAGQSALVV